MRSGAASPRQSLCSRRANLRSTDNQDPGSSGVERSTLMRANEERARGNSLLITCLTRRMEDNAAMISVFPTVKLRCACEVYAGCTLSLPSLYLCRCEPRSSARGLIIPLMSHGFTKALQIRLSARECVFFQGWSVHHPSVETIKDSHDPSEKYPKSERSAESWDDSEWRA